MPEDFEIYYEYLQQMNVLFKVSSKIFSNEFYNHPRFDVHLTGYSLLTKVGKNKLSNNSKFWKFMLKFLLKEKNEKDFSFKTKAIKIIEKLLFYHFSIT